MPYLNTSYPNTDNFRFEENHYDGNLKIFIGSMRTNEFLNLLEKIKERDFERITIGEIYLVQDLLQSFNERSITHE